MKRISLYHIILWYSVLTIFAGIILNLTSVILLLIEQDFASIFPTILFLSIKIAFLLIVMNLLKGKNNRYSLNFILFYWILQIFFFGILGNVYAFSTGPQVALYFKYDTIDIGFVTKYWTQEFSLKLNSNSDRIYFGFNSIPILITFALTYVLPPANRNQAIVPKSL